MMLKMMLSKKVFISTFNDVVTPTSGKFVLAFIDLNAMKMINDTCGHSVGDQVIERVEYIISHMFQTVAKFGGDEFAIIIPVDDTGLSTIEFDLQFLQNRIMNCPVIKELTGFPISVSVGAAVFYSEKYKSFDDCFKAVDALMYEAKKTPPDFRKVEWADLKEHRKINISGTVARHYFEWLTTLIAKLHPDHNYADVLRTTRNLFHTHENITEYSPKILLKLIKKELDNSIED